MNRLCPLLPSHEQHTLDKHYLREKCHKGGSSVGPRDIAADGYYFPFQTLLKEGSEEPSAPVNHLWVGGEWRGGEGMRREGRGGEGEGMRREGREGDEEEGKGRG